MKASISVETRSMTLPGTIGAMEAVKRLKSLWRRKRSNCSPKSMPSHFSPPESGIEPESTVGHVPVRSWNESAHCKI